MKYIRQIKDVFVPLNVKSIDEIELKPGDLIHTFNDNGSPYGSFGCCYATQCDKSRQIEYKPNFNLLENNVHISQT